MTRPGFRSARLLALLASGLMLLPISAQADTTVQSVAVTSCGNMTYANGQVRAETQDLTGKKCVNASVSASITGFAPATTGTPISVANPAVTGTLPAGTVVIAFNTGATNTAFCKLGATATTSDIAIPPNSWFAYTVGAATQLTCITASSTTTVNMVGGSGLPTGAGGGGGGGGGGGAITAASGSYASGALSSGSVASGAYASGALASGSIASGACAAGCVADGGVVTIGAKADAKNAATDTTAVSAISVLKEISSLEQAPASRAVTNAGTFATQSAITAASGALASGSVASGAIASGAIASGAVASGAIVSGACVSGCITDLGTAQGATTSGLKGPLIMGAVTTGAPTYTTAQTDPLSLDTAGNLRVNVVAGGAGNACASATGSAVPASGCLMAGGAAGGTGNQTGATVKAASTTPATTDTSLVTAIADGQDVTLGSKADAANCATTNTQIACIRQLHADATAAIPAGTNLIGKVGIDQTTPGTTNGVQVNAALPAGTNLLGKTGIDQTTPGTTNGVVVNSGPCTGMSVKSFIVAANTTSVAIDASAGSVCGVAVYGVAAATPVWVKLYNLAQGSTTCGTSAVIDRVLGATVSTGNGAVVPLAGGVTYSTAISACVVQGIADNDTTAPAATSYTVSVYYK